MALVIHKIGDHRNCLKKLLASTRKIVRVASAYVTDDSLLLDMRHAEVRLLTGWSEDDIIISATSLRALRELISQPRVYCRVLPKHPKLHSKVYLFDQERAVVSSANLTYAALDNNLEVGVQLRGRTVIKLVDWFDEHWQSTEATVLTEPMIDEMECKTALLRKKFRKLRMTVKNRSNPNHDQPLHVSAAARWYVCNTDRKHGIERERRMHESKFAAAWLDFRSTEQMDDVQKGHIILMYANRAGIIGVGQALDGVDKLGLGRADRIMPTDGVEWRIPVRWLRWDEGNPCPWRPHLNPTFIDVTSEKYARRLNRVRKHFQLLTS